MTKQISDVSELLSERFLRQAVWKLTEYELMNACFTAAEQVCEIQDKMLSAAVELATGGTTQPHVGTGGGGSISKMPWREKDKNLLVSAKNLW